MCLSFNMALYCLPLVPLVLGIIALRSAKESINPNRTRNLAWIGIAGVILLSTVVAYALNTWALARMTATTVAMFMYVQPLVAISFARAALGERPSPRTAAAAALIFAGVALTTWPQAFKGRRPHPQ